LFLYLKFTRKNPPQRVLSTTAVGRRHCHFLSKPFFITIKCLGQPIWPQGKKQENDCDMDVKTDRVQTLQTETDKASFWWWGCLDVQALAFPILGPNANPEPGGSCLGG
jgi:hypothetical protein